ncbi:MAG: type I DNA topoisomerase [Flavobacteriaceae bacterium]|nr:type I DNA topoisomerase [Flavobacteriaceae bacterium]
MSKNLVIVESPAKAKTIEKFLGSDYVVASSFGHVADLPSKEIGVDIQNGFKPQYIISDDKRDVVKKLKDLAKKAEMVWLASDEDREGEAIAWHLFEQLQLKEEKTKRIVFHEITKNAILKAVAHPRSIDYNLVDAQQARRVLDRLVGYELSPVLWRKVKSGLSAGRVQSVAVRLIVERENEIRSFNTEALYKVEAEFDNSDTKRFKARLNDSFKTQKEAEQFLQSCIGAQFKVSDLQIKPAKKSPAAPFTTSTLQQEASRKLGFPVAKTMRVAQQLYEEGLITYMRTDSVNLSKEAIGFAKDTIVNSFGAQYSQVRQYTTKSKGAQEAHEAIRPTHMEQSSINMGYDHDRLYSLIWKRTIASQMSDAELERTTAALANNQNKYLFQAQGEVIKFDGFLKLYLESYDDEEDAEKEGMLPRLTVGEIVTSQLISATERYSRAPFRYSEAALVKKLEELGIGRPSTYAPTISTIQNRGYVEKSNIEGVERKYTQLQLKNSKIETKVLSEKVGADKGKLIPTDIGTVVNDFLVKNFEHVLDYSFTANLESEFDEIADGTKPWGSVVKNFYQDFHANVTDVSENAEREKGERLLGVDPESGKNVYARLARYGAIVQIGESSDTDKPKFASLQGSQTISNITLEDALSLFDLPKTLGMYEGKEVVVSNGRFGPFVKLDTLFVSLPKDANPTQLTLEEAIALIQAKQKADAPVGTYQGHPVQKGVGRFGPFIKWNSMFINVSRQYDLATLTAEQIAEIIETKLKKDVDKVVRVFEKEGIVVEKARWGRFTLIKGKMKVELSKDTQVETMKLEDFQAIIEKNTKKSKPKTAPKKESAKGKVKK